jgi:hypothetical protein
LIPSRRILLGGAHVRYVPLLESYSLFCRRPGFPSGLAHVAFLGVPDLQQPFVDLPPGKRAILGLPLLLALKTIRWNKDGTIEVGASSKRKIHGTDICFDDLTAITEVEFQSRKLEFALDSGAAYTHL